ncbi:hypothetical protein EES43_25525 [Streptomyces sp. ADI96-02]|nr:hypothetical protein EES43_25525 [Streptomyces sp. ADI96-02]
MDVGDPGEFPAVAGLDGRRHPAGPPVVGVGGDRARVVGDTGDLVVVGVGVRGLLPARVGPLLQHAVRIVAEGDLRAGLVLGEPHRVPLPGDRVVGGTHMLAPVARGVLGRRPRLGRPPGLVAAPVGDRTVRQSHRLHKPVETAVDRGPGPSTSWQRHVLGAAGRVETGLPALGRLTALRQLLVRPVPERVQDVLRLHLRRGTGVRAGAGVRARAALSGGEGFGLRQTGRGVGVREGVRARTVLGAGGIAEGVVRGFHGGAGGAVAVSGLVLDRVALVVGDRGTGHRRFVRACGDRTTGGGPGDVVVAAERDRAVGGCGPGGTAPRVVIGRGLPAARVDGLGLPAVTVVLRG